MSNERLAQQGVEGGGHGIVLSIGGYGKGTASFASASAEAYRGPADLEGQHWGYSDFVSTLGLTAGAESAAATMADGAMISAEAYDPATASWTSLPAPPLPARVGAAACSSGGFGVVVGGADARAGAILSSVLLWDHKTQQWSTLPEMMEPRMLCNALAF